MVEAFPETQSATEDLMMNATRRYKNNFGWQPIETYDNRYGNVLVYQPASRFIDSIMQVARRKADGYWYAQGVSGAEMENDMRAPTHWMFSPSTHQLPLIKEV